MPNNQTKPNQTQTTPVTGAGGVSRQRLEAVKPADWKPRADDLPPLTERRAKEFAWAKQHLPGEHTGMVVSALIGMEVAGLERTRNSVLARLESQGRTAEQRRANDKAKGRA